MRILIIFVLIFTFKPTAFSQSGTNILNADFADLELGGGYTAGTRFREDFDDDSGDNYNGLTYLIHARFMIFHFSNVLTISNINNDKGFKLGFLTYYTGHDYESEGLDDRNKHFFGGGFTGYGPFIIYGYADVGSKSSGSVYGFRFTPLIYKSGKATINLLIEGNYYNHRYVDYFFGVTSDEVALSDNISSPYEGKGTGSGELGAVYNRALGTNSRFTIFAKGEWYDKGISDSPTVKKNLRVGAGAGWLYKFF